MCVASPLIRGNIIFGIGQSGKENEITTWKIRFYESETAVFNHAEHPSVIFN